MATFKNYQPRSEGLNAAYEMLLQAELAKAQSMGNAFAPLTEAIRSGQQMKIARDEQERLKTAQAAETDYRTKSMGLDTRRLDLQEKEFNTKQASNEAYDAYMRSLLHGAAPSQPAATGVPFTGGGSAAMTQRPALSAGGLLGPQQPQGMPEPPPGMFTPEQWSNINGAINTMHDNEAQDRKYQQEQALKQQADQAFNSDLAAAVAGKIPGVSEDKGARIRARYLIDQKAATEELHKAQDAHLDRIGTQRNTKTAVKDLRAAILPNDPEADIKNRLLDGLELQVKSLNDIDPTVISKNLEDARGYIYGTDTQARSQRKSEADKQAEAEAKSPFKYITNRDEFKKGGFVMSASDPLKAQVEMQATMMAAEMGKLRNDALILGASNPTLDQISSFQDRMSATEKQAIQVIKSGLWAGSGWSEKAPGPDESTMRALEGPKPEPLNAPPGWAAAVVGDALNKSKLADDQKGAMRDMAGAVMPSLQQSPQQSGIASRPDPYSPAIGMAALSPADRDVLAEMHRAGKSPEEIVKAALELRKKAMSTGTVAQDPSVSKPVNVMEEKSKAFLAKNRLSSLAPADVDSLISIGSNPKRIREFLRSRGFKEGNVLNSTVDEVMQHINTFKSKSK